MFVMRMGQLGVIPFIFVACVMSGVAYPYCGRPVVR